MAEKHLVVQGAVCMCNYGSAPDKLKVLTNTKEYANDSEGTDKLIASTMDVGSTFEKNTFGSCAKKNGNACSVTVTEWKGYFEDLILNNGGKILLEDSLATCPIGGAGCIQIVYHGQIAEMTQQNFENTNNKTQTVLNPGVDTKQVLSPEPDTDGLTLI